MKSSNDDHPTRAITIATAGHVDHGKSRLVECLTGTHPDRLPEEQARGMSIALGYAQLEADGIRIGFVDVPGHERFVRTAISGVATLDASLLVVAADDGVMPQTREHVQILRWLGAGRLLAAVTKIDRVDASRVRDVVQQVASLLDEAGMEPVAVLEVSSETGDGVDAMRDEIVRLARGVRDEISNALPAASAPEFRLDIQRVFTKDGFGTVATGIVGRGEIAVGDEIDALPDGRRARVRRMEVLGRKTDRARAGERAALNLAGLDRHEIQRGSVLATPESLTTTQSLEIELFPPVGFDGTPRKPKDVRILLGAEDRAARGYVVTESTEAPRSFGRFAVEEPIVASIGDRVCLWTPSGRTVGGGVVLSTSSGASRAVAFLERAARRADALRGWPSSEAQEKIAGVMVREHERTPATSESLRSELGMTPARIDALLERMEKAGTIVRFQSNGPVCCLDRSVFEAAAKSLFEAVRNDADSTRSARDWSRLASVAPAIGSTVLQEAATRGLVERIGNDGYTSKRAEGDGEESLQHKLLACFERSGLAKATTEDLAEEVDDSVAAVEACIRKLSRENQLVRLSGNHYVAASVIESTREFLLETFPPGLRFRVGDARDLLGVNRKVAIELFEYFDGKRWTRRVDSEREFI